MICITEIETVFEIFLSLLGCSKTVFFKMSLFYSLYAAWCVTFFHVLAVEAEHNNTQNVSGHSLLKLQYWFSIT